MGSDSEVEKSAQKEREKKKLLALAPIAKPLAGKKLSKRALKLVRRGSVSIIDRATCDSRLDFFLEFFLIQFSVYWWFQLPSTSAWREESKRLSKAFAAETRGIVIFSHLTEFILVSIHFSSAYIMIYPFSTCQDHRKSLCLTIYRALNYWVSTVLWWFCLFVLNLNNYSVFCSCLVVWNHELNAIESDFSYIILI